MVVRPTRQGKSVAQLGGGVHGYRLHFQRGGDFGLVVDNKVNDAFVSMNLH